MTNRPAFLLTGALMVVVMLVGMAAFLLMLSGFVNEITPTIPDVMTDIPTLYDYDNDGKRITEFEGLDRLEKNAEYVRLTAELEKLRIELKECEDVCVFLPVESLKHDIRILEEQLYDLGYQGLTYPNVRLELYWMFAYPSLAILFIFILFSSATHYWEIGFSIFQRGTSIGIIKTSIISMVAIILLRGSQ